MQSTWCMLHRIRWMGFTLVRFRWFLLVSLFSIIFLCIKFIYLDLNEYAFLSYGQSSRISGRQRKLLKSLAMRNNSLVQSYQKMYYLLYWSQSRYFTAPTDEMLSQDCPELACRLTSDRRLLPYSSAVIHHAPDISTWDWPNWRSPNQSYVFASWEAPSSLMDNNWDYRYLSSEFNLTMTYRIDSDIPAPYGSFTSTSFTNQSQFRNIMHTVMSGKSKLIAWFVSHCHTNSEREKLVHELKKYIPVDIYGKCGHLECVKPECDEYEIISQYKFYLSFENSICKDYVTEKFYERLTRDVVPVVLGGSGNFLNQNLSLYPPHGFIIATNFSSTKVLADYLLYLDQNPNEYMKYFQWKMRQTVRKFRYLPMLAEAYCNLCRKLIWVGEDLPRRSHGYENITHWWHDKYPCDNQLVHRFLNERS